MSDRDAFRAEQPITLANKAIGSLMWDNRRSEAARSCRSKRPLTHLIDSSDRQDEMNVTRRCSITDCGRPHLARGWCGAHYYRWIMHGDPGTEPIKQLGAPKQPCSIEACSEPVRCRAFCARHYRQFLKWGDPLVKKVPPTPQTPTGPANVNWKGDAISYGAIHMRLRATEGAAKLHPCAPLRRRRSGLGL